MSVTQHSEHIISAIDELINVGNMTPANSRQCHKLHNMIFESVIGCNKEEYIRHLKSVHTCPYWTEYWLGVATNTCSNIRHSMHLGNPFAEWVYSWKCGDECTLEEIAQFLKHSAYAGVHDALEEYLNNFADKVSELSREEINTDKFESYLDEWKILEPLAVQNEMWIQCGVVCDALYIFTDDEKYANACVQHYLRHHEPWRPPTNGLYTQLLTETAHAQLKELTHLRDRVAQLEKCQNMTLDEVCKSVVKEYV